jgi:nitrogen regulatory protein PII-like uncharacterized protein
VKKPVLLVCVTLFLVACGGPSIKKVQPLSESADIPYDNVLVVTLFESFDIRRNFEGEIVRQLQDRGIQAVASTSMMTTKTPVNRESVLAIVDELGSDSVLVTQLVNLETASKVREANPESTYNVRPTHYYNVWNVELTEYEAPKGLELKHKITMAIEMFSASSTESVWSIETNSQISRDINQHTSGNTAQKEAKGIVGAMSRDGLLAR